MAQHEPTTPSTLTAQKNMMVNPGAPAWYAVSASLVASVVLYWLQTQLHYAYDNIFFTMYETILDTNQYENTVFFTSTIHIHYI